VTRVPECREERSALDAGTTGARRKASSRPGGCGRSATWRSPVRRQLIVWYEEGMHIGIDDVGTFSTGTKFGFIAAVIVRPGRSDACA
jgi:hypothetical protein